MTAFLLAALGFWLSYEPGRNYAEANQEGAQAEAAGDLDSAERLYREAAGLRPQEAGLHMNLGRVLERQGRHAEALDSLGKAIEIQPSLAEAYIERAGVHEAMKTFGPALDDYGAAIKLRPGDAELYTARGFGLLMAGNTAGACVDFDAACSLGRCENLWRARQMGNCITTP